MLQAGKQFLYWRHPLAHCCVPHWLRWHDTGKPVCPQLPPSSPPPDPPHRQSVACVPAVAFGPAPCHSSAIARAAQGWWLGLPLRPHTATQQERQTADIRLCSARRRCVPGCQASCTALPCLQAYCTAPAVKLPHQKFCCACSCNSLFLQLLAVPAVLRAAPATAVVPDLACLLCCASCSHSSSLSCPACSLTAPASAVLRLLLYCASCCTATPAPKLPCDCCEGAPASQWFEWACCTPACVLSRSEAS